MLRTVLLARLGVPELDGNGNDYDLAQARDADTGVVWLALVYALPGDAVTGDLIRCDPGTMGRTLFHFRAAPHDGRYSLAHPCSGEGMASAILPSLPALCAFYQAARAEIVAERVPDLTALAALHLGVAFTLPAIEVRPGDREIRLSFCASNED